jgi:hypothetical protein
MTAGGTRTPAESYDMSTIGERFGARGTETEAASEINASDGTCVLTPPSRRQKPPPSAVSLCALTISYPCARPPEPPAR